MRSRPSRCLTALALSLVAAPAYAQDDGEGAPTRTRIILGPQLAPSFPGSDDHSVRPYVDVARARGDAPFDFAAPDESFGFSLVRSGAFSFGPAIGFESKRDQDDLGVPLPAVGFTVEVGAFAEVQLAEPIRLRAEVRKGLGGHEGWIGVASADYILRDEDRWQASIGPRLTFADDRYHRAYFRVSPAAAPAAGLPAYEAEGGLQAAGVAASYLRQLGPRWGVYTYAKYDRLVEDAGNSPIVRGPGSRDQLSGGVALTYTFGGGRR